MLPSHLAQLQSPSAAALAVSAELKDRIVSVIAASGGWISFARYMQLALYEPGLGYYSAGSAKLGLAGDFVTAPEISALFGRCVARQLGQLIGLGMPDVIEVGAGSGALAGEVLRSLQTLDRVPQRYLILEVSGELRDRQRARLARETPDLMPRVQWVDVLPEHFDGVLVANELLDALPTHVVRTREGQIEELGVGIGAGEQHLERSYRLATGALLAAATALHLPDAYETEINLAARAFVRSFASRIARGAMVFVDYGFPAAEYYHPQRSSGTLMCHYRHHAHADPLILPGLQDITAHVDFTSVADAAIEAGHSVLGYASQAQFLVNCGITGMLEETPAADTRAYAPLAAHAQKLLSPAEMGELFKVIALGKGIDAPLIGFARGDRSHTLAMRTRATA